MKRLSLIAAVLMMTILAGCTPAYQNDAAANPNAADMTKDPVKIGFTGPLTGDVANLGLNTQAAVQIAEADINAAGGIQGRPVKVIFEDDQCVGSKASTGVSKLINVDKVTAVLGSLCSSATLAFTPIAEKSKTVVMSYCSTAPKISQAGDYIFRDVPSDLFQAKFAADYAVNTLAKKKAAVVYINNEWGVGLRDAFKDAYTKVGGTIAAVEGYDPTSKDLRAQMTKVKAADVEMVYFAGFTDGTIAGLKQAKELGLNVTMLGADAWDDTKIWKEVGDAGEGALFTVVGSNSSDEFKAKMKEKLNSDEIMYCSNYAYDALMLMAQTMNQPEVGADSTKLKDALYKAKYEGGVSSKSISFDKNGDPVEAAYVVKKVTGGVASEMAAE